MATGLPSAPVFSLAQDSRGFIWIGAQGGLARYDGHQFRRWAPDQVAVGVPHLAAGPGGEVFGITGTGELFEVTDQGVRFVEDTPGVLLAGVRHLDFDREGTLWLVVDGGLRYRRPDGTWNPIPRSVHGNEAIRFVETAGPLTYATSSTALWRIAAREPRSAERFAVAGISDGLFASADGVVWLGTLTGVKALRDDRIRSVPGLTTRAGPFVQRGHTVWVSSLVRLVGLREGVVAETLGPREGVTSAGALLVDRDGGLWLGTFTGVLYFPEPETQTWNETDGLRTSHGRKVVVPAAGDAWLLLWQGLAQVERRGAVWRLQDRSDSGWGTLCLDGRHRVWTPGRVQGTFARRTPRVIERTAPASGEHVSSCAASSDGGMWFGQASGVFRVSDLNRPPQWIEAPRWPTPGPLRIDAVFEDRHGRLWVTRDADICRAADLRALPVAWDCHTLPGAVDIGGFFHTRGDAIWVATQFSGVWRFHGSEWVQLSGSLAMDTRAFAGFAPAADGTVWVAGGARVTRVEERPGDPAGWREVERLGVWEGYDGVAVTDVAEEPDGTVWLASSAGLVRIPASARQSATLPPMIVATEVLADGVPRDRSSRQPLHAGQALELRYAVTSYRDRRRLTIEARVGETSPWLLLSEVEPALRLAALAPGSYRVEARASADGVRWSPADPLEFVVLPPWYRRWWSLAGLLGLAGLAGAGLYRLRIAMALRLQEQRVRIARDLHDELGAGLGSIGILAGVASGDEVVESERRRLAAVIAESAADLGGALSDIVWSLRRGPSTLKALACHIAERAGRLIPGPTPALTVNLPPEWPDAALSMVLRRNVMLVILEGLRNAARHAHASRITLSLSQAAAGRWMFTVDDDGQGLSRAAREEGRGLGLENMRLRAGEIGATLTLEDSPAGGTRLLLLFDVERGRASRPRVTRSGDGR